MLKKFTILLILVFYFWTPLSFGVFWEAYCIKPSNRVIPIFPNSIGVLCEGCLRLATVYPDKFVITDWRKELGNYNQVKKSLFFRNFPQNILFYGYQCADGSPWNKRCPFFLEIHSHDSSDEERSYAFLDIMRLINGMEKNIVEQTMHSSESKNESRVCFLLPHASSEIKLYLKSHTTLNINNCTNFLHDYCQRAGMSCIQFAMPVCRSLVTDLGSGGISMYFVYNKNSLYIQGAEDVINCHFVGVSFSFNGFACCFFKPGYFNFDQLTIDRYVGRMQALLIFLCEFQRKGLGTPSNFFQKYQHLIDG